MMTSDFLRRVIYGNPVDRWLTAVLIAAGVLLVFLVVRRIVVARLGKIAARTPNRIDDLIVEIVARTRAFVLAIVALLIASRWLRLPSHADTLLITAGKLALLLQAALWATGAVDFWAKEYRERPASSGNRAGIATIQALGIGAKAVIWLLIGFSALKTFGIDVTALVTGLGISGIAIALAVQNILGDLLAALSIVFDKPFDVGDTIVVDQITGTVEHIGLKTTRIRSISGEQIILGNADLLRSRLRNMKRMYQRRAVFHLDVVYDTPPDVVARIPHLLQEIVTAQTPVKFDRSHVATFTESAVRVETVYFVLDPDYNRYMDIQQAIYLAVLRRFAAEKIAFAFPTRTMVHVRDSGVGVRESAVESRQL
jgi:small-conductance mechanosensitive channel